MKRKKTPPSFLTTGWLSALCFLPKGSSRKAITYALVPPFASHELSHAKQFAFCICQNATPSMTARKVLRNSTSPRDRFSTDSAKIATPRIRAGHLHNKDFASSGIQEILESGFYEGRVMRDARSGVRTKSGNTKPRHRDRHFHMLSEIIL
jgi:hypothetical protein